MKDRRPPDKKEIQDMVNQSLTISELTTYSYEKGPLLIPRPESVIVIRAGFEFPVATHSI